MRNKQSLVFLASSLFLLLLAPITSEAISNPSTNINEVNREIVEESANDQATSAPSHSETLEQEPSLETTTTTDNHPAETDQSTATLEPSKQQKDDDNSVTESAIVEPQPRMLAAPYATSLPDDPNIIPIDKVFQEPIGNATSILEGGKLLQLNPAVKSQKGAIWSKKPISLLSDFTFKSYLYLGNEYANAGDGMTFTLTNDPRMSTTPQEVIGSPGMGIGAYSTKAGQPYVRNALSIEFDTYKNTGSSNRMDREISQDKGNGHLAFVTPKANNNSYTGEHSGVTVAPTYLSNGTWRMLTVHWNAATKALTYDLEGVGTNTYVVSDLNAQFGATTVYWGFTSSTGGKYQENALAMTQIPTNVTSQAALSVNGQEFSSAVEAVKNDQVRLRNTLNIDNDFIEDRQPQVSIDLPDELAYEENSLTIDGKKVAAKDLTQTGNHLTITLNDYLVLKKDMIIELKTTLQDNTPEKVLTMNFDYYEEGTLLQKSNNVTITIPKPTEKTVTVFYKDAEGKDIAPPKSVTEKIGTPYQEKPLDISGYVFTKDSGNAEGTMTEETKDIYFYYRLGELYFKEAPKQITFGTEKIRNQPLIKLGHPTEGLKVVDERNANNWRLQLKQTQPLTNDSIVMPDVFSFVSTVGSSQITNEAITLLESNQKGETDLTALLDESKQQGIQINVPVAYQRVGTFKARLSWALEDVPGN
ncbi:MucBP domain-containing protein [Enterococcus faecalis]|uniref:lectin-like domain-containing protein n=1 Tax=Enterococcus TaxID=1350 RepID=UPI000353DB5F|nr:MULTISPECIES: MucBP domain-containing protein [Enterococcus]EGO6028173.1 lectin [Enterococcus faecalis]EGO6609153.1 lectin [Enterococcus faecalis]EGO6643050.1 lectin [Enterococcus faecalis]EGO6704428.1 lectin [Enterococcus faecalis]EGO8331635.1 lectin [Enterococcus faecalis]